MPRRVDEYVFDMSQDQASPSRPQSLTGDRIKQGFTPRWSEYVFDMSQDQARRSQESLASQSSVVGNSAAQKAVDKLSKPEFQRKVADMVRYLLFADRKKTVIKRADMIKSVMKDHSRAFNPVFKEACRQLLETFGYEVVAMETDDGKTKGYTLITVLTAENDLQENLISREDERSHKGLLLVIISMIFMNDNTLTEKNLWHTLAKFGIDPKDKNHNVFGDIEKLINQDFVKQNYLERSKIQGSEGVSFNYHIGSRSKIEISKRAILEFVTEIYDMESIEVWKSKYQDVLDSERKFTERMEDD